MLMREMKITVSDKVLAATFLKLIPKRITPNQVTIFRFFTVPFVVLLLALEEYHYGIALFVVSAFTDALDGALARTTNRVTEWGKVYDPVADKLLILTTALLVVPRHLGIGVVITIIAIEMLTIGSAYYLKNRGTTEIMANGWGKTKMICQSVGVALVLFYLLVSIPWLLPVAAVLLYASIFFAVASLITYGI
ncbi:MAG: CDP-alcohol phosphatidyltransferase family protein [Patescibacteria group bacterium]